MHECPVRGIKIRGLPKVDFLAKAVAEGSQNLSKMPLEDIVTHCKIKHKVTLKWCRPCEKYVLKKQYRMHIQTPLHREVVNNGEKHSSHKTRGLPKVTFLAEAEGEGGKTSALEVKAEGEGKGLLFCIYVFGGHIQT